MEAHLSGFDLKVIDGIIVVRLPAATFMEVSGSALNT
jgi:hypothetical protein